LELHKPSDIEDEIRRVIKDTHIFVEPLSSKRNNEDIDDNVSVILDDEAFE